MAAADWLQQLCLMNFYVHVAKYANEPKTVLHLFLATLKLFYFSCSHGLAKASSLKMKTSLLTPKLS